MSELRGAKLHITGIVQGVGFRPFVYSLAVRFGLNGWVRNTSAGVDIEVDGAPEKLDEFVQALKRELPTLARIDSLDVSFGAASQFTRFEIIEFESGRGRFPAHFPGREHLRRLPARAIRSERQAIPLPVHQLHKLRSALYHYHRYSIRPTQYDHVFVRDVPGLRGGIPKSS